MAFNLVQCLPKHERRLRLLFDNQPASGAFGSSPTTLGYYTVLSQDNLSSAESVTQAIAVSDTVNAIELALANDLAPGGLYLLQLNALPDTGVDTCSQSTLFRFWTDPTVPNVESPPNDYAQLLYGIDLAYSGTDWVETSDGDLLTVEGLPNVEEAIWRRALGDPLPWAPNYGAKTRQFVDGTPGSMPTLKAQLVANLGLDSRVKAVQAVLSFDPNDPWSAYFDTTVTLIGGDTVGPRPVSVKG